MEGEREKDNVITMGILRPREIQRLFRKGKEELLQGTLTSELHEDTCAKLSFWTTQMACRISIF